MTRSARVARMEAILAKAKAEQREFTAEETKEFDGHKTTIEREDTAATVADLDQQRSALKRPQGALRKVAAPAVHTSGERRFSLSKAMRAAIGDTTVDAGYEREVQQELARTR